MKYKELERLLKKVGCFDTKKQQVGHPMWFSPKTGKTFQMSNYGSEEVALGTLKKSKLRRGFGPAIKTSIL